MKKVAYILTVLPLLASATFAQINTPIVSSHSASASVQLIVTIPARAMVKTVHQPSSIIVTARDLKRGFVLLPNAYVFKLWCNTRDGSKVSLDWNSYITDEQGNIYLPSILQYRLNGETEFRSFESSDLPIYETWQKQNFEEITMDLRLKLARGMPAGRYSYQANLVASPHSSGQSNYASMDTRP